MQHTGDEGCWCPACLRRDADDRCVSFLAGVSREDVQAGMAAPGKVRTTDPATAKAASVLLRTRKTSARWQLLAAHGRQARPLTDEEAAVEAGLGLTSEYATRCAELRTLGVIEETREMKPGRSGVPRMCSRVTALGKEILRLRGLGVTMVEEVSDG